MLKFFVVNTPNESVTRAVNGYEPAVVEVPLIPPVLEFSVNPGGNGPGVRDHVKAPDPPIASST